MQDLMFNTGYMRREQSMHKKYIDNPSTQEIYFNKNVCYIFVLKQNNVQ